MTAGGGDGENVGKVRLGKEKVIFFFFFECSLEYKLKVWFFLYARNIAEGSGFILFFFSLNFFVRINICREMRLNCRKECNVGMRLKPWPVYKAVLRHKE